VVRVLLINAGEAAVEVKTAQLLVGVGVATGSAGAVERAGPWNVVVDEAGSDIAQEIQGKAGVGVPVCSGLTTQLVSMSCHGKLHNPTL
jgi:hypothetical protein